MTCRRIASLSIVLWITCACAACAERKPRAANADSRALPAVADSPALVIGVVDGEPEYQFVDVVGATRRPDGTIVVADHGTNSLRFYDARGKFIRKSGRTGAGPGEYVMLGEFVPLQDGFLVSDWRLPRISFLDANGKFLRAFEEPASPVREEEGFENGIPLFRYSMLSGLPPYVLATRAYHPSMSQFRYKPNVEFRDTIKLVTLQIPRRDGERLIVVDSLPAMRSRWLATRMSPIPNGTYIQTTRQIPFSPYPAVAAGRDRIYVADSDSFVIRVLDLRGQLIRTIREERTLDPVTDDDIAVVKAMMAGNNRDERGRPFASSEIQRYINWYFANVPVSKTKPARSQLFVDGNQNLWVQDFSLLEAARRPALVDQSKGIDGRWWTVFDSAGTKLGRVELPKGLIVLEIGADYLLGLAIDELEVQTIALYPLTFKRPL